LEIVKIEEGAEGVRITFVDGHGEFRGGDEGREVLDAWRLDRRLMGETAE
jgi:hypothetical protein